MLPQGIYWISYSYNSTDLDTILPPDPTSSKLWEWDNLLLPLHNALKSMVWPSLQLSQSSWLVSWSFDTRPWRLWTLCSRNMRAAQFFSSPRRPWTSSLDQWLIDTNGGVCHPLGGITNKTFIPMNASLHSLIHSNLSFILKVVRNEMYCNLNKNKTW